MIPANKTVEIYYLVDEFLKEYDAVIKSHSLEEGAPKKRRNGKFTMSNSENMTILILFHSSSFRNLKHFYIFIFVRAHMQKDFPHTASYNRFVELQRKVWDKCTSISFIDSTPIRSCHIKREKSHKTFKKFARKSTLGWFYEFKLHLIIYDKRELPRLSSHSGQRRRQNALENHELPQTNLRQAFRRQWLHLERSLRATLH